MSNIAKTHTAALVASAAILLASSVNTWADDDEIPFTKAHLFFELNDTDGDLGIHSLIDGEPWKRVSISDGRRRIFSVYLNGRLRRQGLTELFFESAEPTFDELRPHRFFKRFPAGEYEIEGRTIDGQEMESETILTHVMPAPAMATVNGLPMGTQCEQEEPNFDPPSVSPPVRIEWMPVTLSHPDPNGGGAGIQPPVPVTINNYEVVSEYEDADGFASKTTMIASPSQTSVTLPEEFTGLGESGDIYKFEVLTREVSYNQTARESCFLLM